MYRKQIREQYDEFGEMPRVSIKRKIKLASRPST